MSAGVLPTLGHQPLTVGQSRSSNHKTILSNHSEVDGMIHNLGLPAPAYDAGLIDHPSKLMGFLRSADA